MHQNNIHPLKWNHRQLARPIEIGKEKPRAKLKEGNLLFLPWTAKPRQLYKPWNNHNNWPKAPGFRW
jgi:hypothetical protein